MGSFPNYSLYYLFCFPQRLRVKDLLKQRIWYKNLKKKKKKPSQERPNTVMFIKFLLPLDIELHGSGEGPVSLDSSYKSNGSSSLASITNKIWMKVFGIHDCICLCHLYYKY